MKARCCVSGLVRIITAERGNLRIYLYILRSAAAAFRISRREIPVHPSKGKRTGTQKFADDDNLPIFARQEEHCKVRQNQS